MKVRCDNNVEKMNFDVRRKNLVKERITWLIVNLITAIMAATVVGIFQDTISKVVALATFMPIVAGMGGNAGTQSMTIVIRNMTLKEFDKKKVLKAFKEELSIGFITGTILSIIICIIGYLYAGNYIFGIVIGLAMFLNIVASAIAGFCVPLILKKLKVDPAVASSVFVTTVTDVLGFFFFLGLSTV